MNFGHVSVMLGEVLDALDVKTHGSYLDCTLGGGGHARAIAQRLADDGLIVGIDRDDEAIRAAEENLSDVGCTVKIVRGNFGELDKLNFDKVSFRE